MAQSLANVNSPTTALIVPESELIDEWLAYSRQADNASEATIRAYRKGMSIFADWLLESGQAGTVTPQTVVAFKGDLQERYSPQTVNLRLTAVRSFYRYLVITERIAINPAAQVRGAKRKDSKKHKRQRLSNGEVVAVLATCDDSRVGTRDRGILSLLAYCGLRTIEIRRARIADLRTADDRLVLDVHGKGDDREAVIPRHEEPVIRAWLAERKRIRPHAVTDPLFVSLSNRSRGAALTTRAIAAMVTARYQAAGVTGQNKTPHSLRHSAGTSALRHGASPLQVQQMLGHKSFDTTLIYVHQESRLTNPAEDFVDYGAQPEQDAQ